jgi:hypothetical protein
VRRQESSVFSLQLPQRTKKQPSAPQRADGMNVLGQWGAAAWRRIDY